MTSKYKAARLYVSIAKIACWVIMGIGLCTLLASVNAGVMWPFVALAGVALMFNGFFFLVLTHLAEAHLDAADYTRHLYKLVAAKPVPVQGRRAA